MADIPNELLRALLDNTIKLKQLYGQIPDLTYMHCAEALLDKDIKQGCELLKSADAAPTQFLADMPPNGRQVLIKETLAGISARIHKLKYFIDNKQYDIGLEQINLLTRILPKPSGRHINAAQGVPEAPNPKQKQHPLMACFLEISNADRYVSIAMDDLLSRCGLLEKDVLRWLPELKAEGLLDSYRIIGRWVGCQISNTDNAGDGRE